MKKIDAQQVIANIYEIAKRQNILIRDLEQRAGVSIGYLSKMNRPDARLSLDVIYSIAGDFGMTMEALISYDSAGTTSQEQKIVNLFNKLIADTNTDKLGWKLYSESFWSNAYTTKEREGKEREGLPPLCSYTEADVPIDPKNDYVQFVHDSQFLNFQVSENITEVRPVNGFLADLGNGVQVYVVKAKYIYPEGQGMSVKFSFTGHEMYFTKKGAVTKVCQADAAEYPAYLDNFEKLEQAIKNYDARGRLDKNANAIIDDYLGIAVDGKPGSK